VFGLRDTPRPQRTHSPVRSRIVALLDVLAATALGAAVVSFLVGGFVLDVSIVTVSVRSWLRPLVIGLVLAGIRHQLRPYDFEQLVKRRELLPLGEAELFDRAPGGFVRRFGGLVVLTLAYGVLVAIATWPQIAELHRVSDKGDPLFSIWRLSWVSHEFFRNPLNIFNGNQFYPEPRTLTYSDPVLYPAVLFAPLTWLGLHRVTAYNLVFLAGGVF
jgi:hypothetical protein